MNKYWNKNTVVGKKKDKKQVSEYRRNDYIVSGPSKQVGEQQSIW